MRTLYLDCGMGAAGDMLTAALAELLPDREAFFAELNALGIPGVSFLCEPAEKCGIRGSHVSVTVNGVEEMHDHDHDHHHDHDHEHHHHHHGHHHGYRMAEIGQIVKEMRISEKVKEDILAVYGLIAEAESHVHGKTVEEIHFHEVGTMDAVADVTAVCMLMDRLAPERVIASPVHVGSGQVKCAHGILPVPAPATAYILRDVPIYGGSINGELCTPTGAALLKHFVTEFGSMPVMRTERIGYGMGKKDFPAANCVRALLGQTGGQQDQIVELRCNIDDMTAEALAYASEVFFGAGALDVYTVPIQMKKSRVGMLLTVMCREKDRDAILPLIFRHTSTLGVRESISRRHTLSRKMETVTTEYGEVRKKVSSGYGIKKEKYEYEDLAAIAGKTGMSVDEVRDIAKKADEA